MSRYLIDRIAALPNVELHTGTEVVGAGRRRGQGLTAAVFRERARRGNPHLSAAPSVPVHWRRSERRLAENCVAVDDKGFVVTGTASPRRQPSAARSCRSRPARPGVFAIGDVRAGSTKRVAAAVGEGAAVVAQIHTVLANSGTARLTTPNLP